MPGRGGQPVLDARMKPRIPISQNLAGSSRSDNGLVRAAAGRCPVPGKRKRGAGWGAASGKSGLAGRRNAAVTTGGGAGPRPRGRRGQAWGGHAGHADIAQKMFRRSANARQVAGSSSAAMRSARCDTVCLLVTRSQAHWRALDKAAGDWCCNFAGHCSLLNLLAVDP